MATLTVITLTRNRLEKVRRLIDRLLPQLAAGDEILLIDTGSTDGTRERLAELNNPAIRSVYYDGPGSWAEMRNFGVRHAAGDTIAFLDDDCLPDPDWVARGKAALGDADAVGGMVRPLGIYAFPRWWHPEMAWMVGLSVPGQTGPDAGRVHYPFTANLWARASVCRAVPFQELGGDMGGDESKRYRTGREDAQWWRALRTLGYRTRFDSAIGVGHAIDPARLDLDYLRRRARMDGRAWAVREGTPEDVGPLAYQCWRQLFLALGAVFTEPEERLCHWHFHRLTFERHGAALRGLERKFLGVGAASGATRRRRPPFQALAFQRAGPPGPGSRQARCARPADPVHASPAQAAPAGQSGARGRHRLRLSGRYGHPAIGPARDDEGQSLGWRFTSSPPPAARTCCATCGGST